MRTWIRQRIERRDQMNACWVSACRLPKKRSENRNRTLLVEICIRSQQLTWEKYRYFFADSLYPDCSPAPTMERKVDRRADFAGVDRRVFPSADRTNIVCSLDQ